MIIMESLIGTGHIMISNLCKCSKVQFNCKSKRSINAFKRVITNVLSCQSRYHNIVNFTVICIAPSTDGNFQILKYIKQRWQVPISFFKFINFHCSNTRNIFLTQTHEYDLLLVQQQVFHL